MGRVTTLFSIPRPPSGPFLPLGGEVSGAVPAVIELPEDPDLRDLVLRAMAATRTHESAVGDAQDVPARSDGVSIRLASDRACIESNLARKGLWHPGASCGTGIVELVAVRDQLGLVERIDDGPVLGGLSFELLVWVCSRWRELGDPDARRIPFTIAGLAADLGWRKGGGAGVELTRVVDGLTRAAFRARVFNARHRRSGSTPSG